MEQAATGLLVVGWRLALALAVGIPILTTVGVFLLARFTHVFDTYAGERAKLLAQFHNLDKLVEQTAKITETTKLIESRVSYDLWDRQMRLTYLRETYIKLMEALARLRTSQLHLRHHQDLYWRSAPSDPMPDERMESVKENGSALADFVKIRDTAFLVISDELFHFLQVSIGELRATHTPTWQDDCHHNIVLIEKVVQRVRHTARVELGYEPTTPPTR